MVSAFSFLDLSFDIHLLVEDWRTYHYLSSLFPILPFKLQLLPVGGCRTVGSLVDVSWQRDADIQVRGKTFGVRDRDFGSDNCDRWSSPEIHVFCDRVHEIENYLLDWEAMANCDLADRGGKTTEDFHSLCANIAKDMLYDVVCCEILFQLHTEYGNGFPRQPQQRRPRAHLSSLDEAKTFILDDAWLSNRGCDCARIFDRTKLEKSIVSLESKYQTSLATGDWLQLFPGKEIFERAMNDVYHGEINLEDMVKSIGKYQCIHHRIPNALQRIIDELDRRRYER